MTMQQQNTTDYSDIDVKIQLSVDGNNNSSALKRIKAPSTLKQLQAAITAFAAKQGITQPIVQIMYKDKHWVDVDDEDDYELGMTQIKKTAVPKTVTFVASFQKSAYPDLEEKKEPAPVNPVEDFEMIDEEDLPAKGIKKQKKTCQQKTVPRKALKNMINNELQKQSREVFSQLLKDKNLGGAIPEDPDADLYDDPQDDVVHLNVECDGCGMNPIKGIRYKCSVRKNFDYCETCEERLGHEYPMLKIRQAGGAPTVLITMLPEDAPMTKEEKELGQQFHTSGEEIGKAFEQQQPKGEDTDKDQKCHRGPWGGRGGPFGGRGGPFGGRGRGGMHGPCGGFGRGMGGGGFMKMVNGFMEKMGGKEACMQMKQDFCQTMREGSEEQKKAKWEEFGKKMSAFGEHASSWKPEYGENWGKDWGKDKKWGCDNEGNSWNSQRAKVVTKPEGVLSACPGTSLIEEIEVLNDTYWPWKQGCTLTLADEQSFTEVPIEIISVPVEQEVKGKCTMKICVPLTVLPHIQADENQIYTINLTFRGPKGQAFGEVIPIQLKVTLPVSQVDELEIYKLAIKLHELNLGSFEECAKAAKENGCSESASIQALQRK